MCFYTSVIIYLEWLEYTLQIAGVLIASAAMVNNTSHNTSHDHTIYTVATHVHVSVIDFTLISSPGCNLTWCNRGPIEASTMYSEARNTILRGQRHFYN